MTFDASPDSLAHIRHRIRSLQGRRSMIELTDEEQQEYERLLEAESGMIAGGD